MTWVLFCSLLMAVFSISRICSRSVRSVLAISDMVHFTSSSSPYRILMTVCSFSERKFRAL